jgi:hypothetical protein
MENFFNVAFSFPTIIFSIILIILSGYWLFTIMGFFDIEFLDMDVDLDYGGEANPTHIGGIAGVLVALGLVGIPISIIFSFIILFTWLGTYLTSLYVLSHLDTGFLFWFGAFAAIIVSIMMSIPITIAMTKPMRRFFKISYATKSNDLLGEVCQMITSEVTETFGEAELNKSGDHYIFQVRSKQGNTIKKGDDVVLIEYDHEQHLYHIKKY